MKHFGGHLLAGWWWTGPEITAAGLLVAATIGGCARSSAPLVVRSPDGKIDVAIRTAKPLSYSVSVDGQPVLQNSALGLALQDGTTLGADVELVSSDERSEDATWENPLGKRRHIRDHYRETRLTLHEKSAGDRKFEVIFRVFDDGVAFRYVIPEQHGLDEFVVDRELTEFRFSDNYTCLAGAYGSVDGYRSPQEWEFKRIKLSDFKPQSVFGLPVLVESPAAWVAIAEADLLDWSGMWIGGADKAANATPSDSPAVTLVAKLAPRLDGGGLVKATAPHQSSWRVLMIGRQPGQLIESEIIRNLSTPCKLADTSWVKPGMMAWDHWWSGDTIMDTATIKSYIQLAAEMGWPYQLIDWQWYGEPNKPDADITHVVPKLDMKEVRRFAKEKNVRLWLWLHSNDVERDKAYERAFPLYESWGIAGVKIDFMDRDDQEMVNWYEKITAAAAEHHLLVNFHGAFKTSGFDRTYPNQITREGILGNEYNKWSDRVTPEHKMTLVFTRYLEGPADFTPGGFLNRQPAQFKPNVKPTPVQGTRAGELALFVCYDSPLCCVCDHPDNLRNQPGSDFLKIVPTVWDNTRVVDAAVGEHLVMVRQSGQDWFLGAMTDRQPREIAVKLDFLDAGRWKLKLWQDAADSGENAEHLDVEDRSVSPGDTITLKLAPSGGCVGQFVRQ